ncbi:nucleoside hydrolase [Kineococcus rhizosphaerae]|uniref:Inosine-uridine preferring nucleoside hydrolase n=1 Tax=Kineococcus rhizosphaerae TaxID=559628 RepID=A0A2T0RB65_9ACTN|nr:nucleoside hydrolase [Kineococcus rhizosphaerae]PRY18380.1 inosine-uridine preferring nucleoside hydrolase [Kineococcus rhizosphaerae]
MPLTVVCAGPLTNVAHALAADPGLARRFSLTWVGGSRTGAAEYNRDTDPRAAEFVLGLADLRVRQYPLETYRQCAWSVRELEEFLTALPPAGPWLWRRFTDLPLPPGFAVDPVWPLGDSCPLLDTALSTESSTWEPGPREGVSVCIRLDVNLLFGDLRAVLGRHSRGVVD